MSKQSQWRKPTIAEEQALQIAFSESRPDKKHAETREQDQLLMMFDGIYGE